MKHELAQMAAQGHGAVVNIATGAGWSAPRLQRLFRFESGGHRPDTQRGDGYANQNIRVNAVCPALVNTPLVANMGNENKENHAILMAAHPLGRIAEP